MKNYFYFHITQIIENKDIKLVKKIEHTNALETDTGVLLNN